MNEPLVQALAVLLVVAGAAIYFLPVGECRICDHCSAERVLRTERRRLGGYCFEHRGVRAECDKKEHKR
jgi:predicted metal-binding protein